MKNWEEYYAEAGENHEPNGNNINHTEEAKQDSALPEYKTHDGRTVYGGGGITPDYIIKASGLTNYTTELLKNNVFYPYVLNYLDQHKKALKEKYGNDLKKFVENFSFNNSQLNDFVNYAKSKGVKFSQKEYDKDKNYIAARLKAQVARTFWNNDGWYDVILGQDNQFQKALTLFSEEKDLAGLK